MITSFQYFSISWDITPAFAFPFITVPSKFTIIKSFKIHFPNYHPVSQHYFRVGLLTMTLGTKWYDFPGKQTLRFWDLHVAGLLGIYQGVISGITMWGGEESRIWEREKLNYRHLKQWLPLILWGALEQGCSYRTALHQARAWVFVLPHQSVYEWGWLSQEGTQKWCIAANILGSWKTEFLSPKVVVRWFSSTSTRKQIIKTTLI